MAQSIEVKVPEIGDFEGVDVIEVLVTQGATVAVDESLITLESDKATMEVPAPAAGVVQRVAVQVGDQVSEGDLVVVIDVTGESATIEQKTEPAPPVEAAQKSPEKAQAEPAAKAEPAAATPRKAPPLARDVDAAYPENIPYASPAIRRFARELGVDLGKVTGSGRGGRIQRQDVKQYVKGALAATASGGGPDLGLAPARKVDFARFGEIELQPLTRIQKISGPNLHRNWVMIPHVTQHDEADVTDMEEFRKANKDDAASQGIRLTPIAFLMKACVRSLKKFPQFNSSLSDDGESLVLKKYFHIGVAVDTPNGLVVPVIRDCDKKGLLDLAKELGDVSQRARDGKLSPKDLQGGCISISSLGGIGGTAFSPIINAPEVAILGASRTSMKPVWNGKEFEPRLMMPLSLSYDHRVIDGASAARFTRYLADLLADLRRVML